MALDFGGSMPSEKTRCLHLIKIFEEETDDDHGLSTPQLIEKLAERGLSVERKRSTMTSNRCRILAMTSSLISAILLSMVWQPGSFRLRSSC